MLYIYHLHSVYAVPLPSIYQTLRTFDIPCMTARLLSLIYRQCTTGGELEYGLVHRAVYPSEIAHVCSFATGLTAVRRETPHVWCFAHGHSAHDRETAHMCCFADCFRRAEVFLYYIRRPYRPYVQTTAMHFKRYMVSFVSLRGRVSCALQICRAGLPNRRRRCAGSTRGCYQHVRCPQSSPSPSCS